ncbi:MAG: hypothetical protein WKF46_06205 [Candidatus Limnocylindrales bacterium]
MEAGPIRVWLEPGYDYGRYGAWMLDWPGCFVWGDSREDVLSRVPGAVRRHAEWLASFGEPAAVPTSGSVEVVEEAAARVIDGYERNAIFAADHRPLGSGELEAMLRQLGFARSDLGRLRQRPVPAPGAPTASKGGRRDEAATALGAAAQREMDEVLRHIAGAEIWLASRLDRSVRYGGAPRDGDLSAYLEETRAWLIEQLRGFLARDPAMEAIDGKGEEWTLAKVLRRSLYHSLDHFGELETRYAAGLD